MPQENPEGSPSIVTIERDNRPVLEGHRELCRATLGGDIEVIARAELSAGNESGTPAVLADPSRARGVTEGAILASGLHVVCTVSFFLTICNQANFFVAAATKRTMAVKKQLSET